MFSVAQNDIIIYLLCVIIIGRLIIKLNITQFAKNIFISDLPACNNTKCNKIILQLYLTLMINEQSNC